MNTLITLKLRLSLILGVLTVLLSFASAQAQDKRLIVVPASGPLAGRQVYANSYAVLIGINDYPNLPPNLSLSYAVKDATDLRDVLIQSYGFPAAHITLLTNAQATRRNIEDAIYALTDSSKVKPDDRVLIFFSGHGQTVSQTLGGETGFLIPEDVHDLDLAHPDNIGPYNSSCLSMTWLRDTMQSSPAKHVLLLADACYSGLLARSKGIESLNSEVVAEDMSLPARQVITAGRRGETSEERSEYGHGAFTYKLLEQLRARAATSGLIFTTTDLYASLRASVSGLTHGKQMPQLGSFDTEGDFLFITTPAQIIPPLPPLVVPPVVKPPLTPEQQQQANDRLFALWQNDKGKPDYNKMKAITEAAVQQALDVGADVNATDKNSVTILLAAAYGGRTEVVRLLLDKGANIKAKSVNGVTPLLVASGQEKTDEVIRLLLDKGAEVNAKDDYGSTALIDATGSGHTETARLLLDKGADINAKDNDGATALMEAAYLGGAITGHVDTVRLLLDNEADVNAKDHGGQTALIMAARAGHAEIVRLLLDKGADVNAKTDEGQTALSLAIKENNTLHFKTTLEIVAMLRAAGAKE